MSPTTEKQTSIHSSMKLRLIVSACILLVLALGFNAMLSLNSLEKLYVESIASQYSAIGKDLQRNLEQALRFGKSIEKFVGMEKILEEAKQNITREIAEDQSTTTILESEKTYDLSVSVALPDGTILYSTETDLVGTQLEAHAQVMYEDTEEDQTASRELSYVKAKDAYITPLAIRDRRKTWVATAIIMFSEEQVKSLLNKIRNSNIQLIALILVSSFVLLILLFRLVTPNIRRIEINSQNFPKFRIYAVMFLVIGGAQIVFSGLNVNAFREYYLAINKQKTRMLTTLLKEDIEFLFSKGIRIDKLIKMDVVMGEIIEASPELNDISILDHDGIPLYMATKHGVIDFQQATDEQLYQAYELMSVPDPEYNIQFDLVSDDTLKGYISTNLSKAVIFRKLWEIGLDSATILVISFLFFIELLILLFQVIERHVASPGVQAKAHYSMIRPAVFLFLFGIDATITFLPLYMETLYEPFFGLSKDLVIGLPISVQMLFAGISILIAGNWLDRRGWHEPFLSGLFLAGAGTIYSWLAPNALHFIISRGVVGLGYGLAWMSPQGFVVASTNEENRTQGLANMFAGLLAGSICGASAGAMLAERIGYVPVFLFSAILVFSVIAYTVIFMRNAMQKPVEQAQIRPTQSLNLLQTVRFLANRNILSLLLFSAIPGALAAAGFLNYFSPIYLNRIGESQSNIGRVYMLFGLCLIYIAPFISKYIDASKSKKTYIVVTGMLGGLAFVMFHFFGGMVAATVAILLLGLSVSFGGSQRAYMLKLKSAQELGPGKAMGIFNSADRVGQVLGPIAFGWLLVAMDIQQGITYFGAAYLLITIFFLLFAQSDKKIAMQKQNS